MVDALIRAKDGAGSEKPCGGNPANRLQSDSLNRRMRRHQAAGGVVDEPGRVQAEP
ncbi:hypothetical protein [Paracoccus benzoatiresistens]|uniref:Transposase n=1 Tax=Paracoccus benzoatiresistens TaxID=2997341 RepID=A0ABT4J6E6_9RHOB|nr:hypothetical protein [Paracoccus sp. EF6]MCZ0962240.1 hypothetical protein [Paracoccus sp. EF6]